MTLLAMLALASAAAAEVPTATLTVRVAGLRKAQGKVEVTVYKDARGFPEERALRREVVGIDAAALTAQATFRKLPPGYYAVAVIHDANGNGKLDRNVLGIPKEGRGASNNPAPARRPPTFEEAKFTLSTPKTTLEVNLIH